jgi:hypothetical protein
MNISYQYKAILADFMADSGFLIIMIFRYILIIEFYQRMAQ